MARSLTFHPTPATAVDVDGLAAGTSSMSGLLTGGQLTPVFFSDWRTATNGNALTDQRDGNKWAHGFGSSNNAEIVAAPAGFPTAKAFFAHTDGAASSGGFQLTSFSVGGDPETSPLPAMDVDDVRNIRWYLSMVLPGQFGDPFNHPWQDGGSISQANWSFDTHMEPLDGIETNFSDTEWGCCFTTNGGGAALGRHYLGTGNFSNMTGVYTKLEKAHPYRIELQLVRISSTQHRAHLSIFDGETEEPLYDDADFVNHNNTGTLASNPTLPTNVVNNLRQLAFGCEGFGPSFTWAGAPVSPPYPMDILYMAGVAVVDGLEEGDIVGPYGNVVGEVLP